MAAIMTTDITATAREVDFVERFAHNMQGLQDLLGVSRLIRKAPGTVLKHKYAEKPTQTVAQVGEGEEIGTTKYVVKEKDLGTIAIQKYAKEVTLEAIAAAGYEVAVQKTDDEMLYELQADIMNRWYAYANTGTLTGTGATFQEQLAKAKGLVENKFKTMHRAVTGVIGFANIMDFYGFLGATQITVQTEYGMHYIRGFMGYDTIFLCADSEVAQGTVLAMPRENINIYYIDPSDAEIANAGLSYTTAGVTPLVGVHTEGSYNNATSKLYAIDAIAIFAEYIDGIAKVTAATA